VKGVNRGLHAASKIKITRVNTGHDMWDDNHERLENTITILDDKLVPVNDFCTVDSAFDDAETKNKNPIRSRCGAVRLLIKNKKNFHKTTNVKRIGCRKIGVANTVNAKVDGLENTLAAIALKLTSSASDKIQRGSENEPVRTASNADDYTRAMASIIKLELKNQHKRLGAAVLATVLKAAALRAAEADHTTRAKTAATSAITGATKEHLARKLGLRAIERRSRGPACSSTRSKRLAVVSRREVV